MDISIIIPAFNAGKTLGRCIESVKKQINQEIIREVLIINDGSTDNTIEVVEHYQSHYEKIQLINKSNGGVSSARNMGIRVAKGDLVMFLDSDDEMMPCCCETLFNAITKSCCDMAVCGYDLCSKNSVLTRLPTGNICETGIDIVNSFDYLFYSFFLNAPWGRILWRKKINVLFDENLQNGEDVKFILDYLSVNSKCIGVNQNLYKIYIDNENSLSRGRLHALEGTTQTQTFIGTFIKDNAINTGWDQFSDYCLSLIWTNVIDGRNLGQFTCKKGYESIKWTREYKEFLKSLTPKRMINIILKMLLRYKIVTVAYLECLALLKRHFR